MFGRVVLYGRVGVAAALPKEPATPFLAPFQKTEAGSRDVPAAIDLRQGPRRPAAPTVTLGSSGTRSGLGTMIKSELVKHIHTRSSQLSRRDVEKVVDAILEEIISAIARGDRVELRGFGTFSARVRSAHAGRNPKTGTDLAVPTKVKPHFKAGKEMRERLNPPLAGGGV